MNRLMAAGLLVLMIVPAPPCINAEEAGEIILPRQIERGGKIPNAVFSHAVHRIQFKCYVCHDAIFQMQLGADHVSMDGIQ